MARTFPCKLVMTAMIFPLRTSPRCFHSTLSLADHTREESSKSKQHNQRKQTEKTAGE